jgi:hypothetical protein
MTCTSRRSSRVRAPSDGFGDAVVALLLLFLGGSLGCSVDVAAQGALQTSPPDVSDTVQESDLAGQYLLVLPTTQLEVGEVQTPPWTVTATITTVSSPAPFSEPALTLREVGTSTWLASGGTVKAASNAGEAFGVEYRLDLRALGNGTAGAYVFDVTYRLIADGAMLDSETVQLTISTSETVSVALSGSVGNLSLTAALLTERYVSLAGSIDVDVLAISNYRLTLSCTVDLAPDSPGLLVISSSGIVVQENPAGGVLSTNGGLVHQPVRDNPWLFTQSFVGSNSAGQPTVVRVSFRIDLDAIGNGTGGEVRQVVATFTLTEE